MKIWYQFPRPVRGAEAFYDMLNANWRKVAKLDSELIIKAPTKGMSEFKYAILGHLYVDMLRTIEMVEGIVQAEREGYDAAVVGCFGDPCLDVMEALVDIPVVGPGKAAILMAQTFGNKMAFITIPNWEKTIEKMIKAYGIQDLVIHNRPVRALKISLEQFKEENQVLNNFLDLAKEAIKDGADVILAACCNTSTFFTYKEVTDIDGIPIIDGVIAALKWAESLVDFKKAGLWKSKKSIPNDVKEFLRKEYYHGVESV